MCGIIGFYQSEPVNEQSAQIAKAMADRLTHRGPDDCGVWKDDDAGIVLAHRRLSILDLSASGHQPMISESGRFVVVFNGEIYNHLQLRSQLNCSRWRGYSDTETLLAAIEEWGVVATITKTVGMFALAIWDRSRRELILVRDRLGEKPLYYGWQGGTFLFGSELKALRVHPAFCHKINAHSLPLLLRYGYVPAPASIYEGMQKLPPGTIMTLNHRTSPYCLPEPQQYWSMQKVVQAGKAQPFEGGDDDAIKAIEGNLVSAVKLQMIADVPLGAFLSGGIDSSAVVAVMQSQSARPIKTFTVGFTEEQYNEANYAKAVADHLGTDHTEMYVSPQEAMDVIPDLPLIYDEPLGDSSGIPTFLVAKLAKEHVTVALSGDGGDELFGGYSRYTRALSAWKRVASVPSPLRGGLAGGLALLPDRAMDWVGGALKSKGTQVATMPPSELVKAYAEMLKSPKYSTFYKTFVSHWRQPERVLCGAVDPLCFIDADGLDLSKEELMMYLDTMSYLPDDILVKMDRAAMGVSLETRVPFLDHRLVECAWSMPLSHKMRCGEGKWVLRQLLYKYVPRNLIDRPKKGFGVPIDYWLRGSLRDWAEDLLSVKSLTQNGYFKPDLIRRRWHEHLTGQYNWRDSLWTVLMFQAWIKAQRQV